jgi:hypothetical protein
LTDLASHANRIGRIATRVADRIPAAAEWLDDHIADGYPTNTAGTEGTGGDPAHSPTLDAVTTTRTLRIPVLELEGLHEVDLRGVRIHLARALDQAEDNLRWAQQILDAIPRAATGERARSIDSELRRSRCEGWAEQHAICDDLTVKRATVDGSTWQLCGRCYKAMWRATEDAGERGRVTRDEHVA